jgi:hypothetical protein
MSSLRAGAVHPGANRALAELQIARDSDDWSRAVIALHRHRADLARGDRGVICSFGAG